MNSGTERDGQVEARVREHLQPGETFRAAVWVSRTDERSPVGMTRAEMSPFRFRLRRSDPGGPGARRGAFGSPHSFAVGLDEHVRLVTHPRILTRTDRRLLLLSERRGLLRPASATLPRLRLLWECSGAELVSATEKAGRLRLTFADGSTVNLLTPSAGVRPFLTA